MRVIKNEIRKADIPQARIDSMTQPYSGIAVHPELGKSTEEYPRGILYELIKMLNDKVWPFISIYHDFDVVGQFYGEFLKYTGGDKKALGIVLTPRHITELFAQLANVRKDSSVLDICAGTGGFLVSAMHQMFKQAETKAEKETIKKLRLVGVEHQPHMFALAASNMILRGDGKANLYQGDCFENEIFQNIKNHKCNIGMLNPPYSKKDPKLHELAFIKHMLDCLTIGGTGVAIVPIPRAIAPHPKKAEILKYHTLDAVMSLPNELFYPVGTIPCIMIFKAHIPHTISNKKTWFGYWKDDGFVKTKNNGRIDEKGAWASIREHWIESYKNRDEIPGDCVKQYVTEKDEWCAEAYLETDYSTISKRDFEETVRNFAAFKMLNQTDKNG